MRAIVILTFTEFVVCVPLRSCACVFNLQCWPPHATFRAFPILVATPVCKPTTRQGSQSTGRRCLRRSKSALLVCPVPKFSPGFGAMDEFDALFGDAMAPPPPLPPPVVHMPSLYPPVDRRPKFVAAAPEFGRCGRTRGDRVL